MGWFRVDDAMTEHPKCVTLSPFAWTLWLHALGYCSRNLTDGNIPQAILPRLCAIKDADKAAAELVDAGLWHVTPDGWAVHDDELFMLPLGLNRYGPVFADAPLRRPNMPRTLRQQILVRDGHRCQACGSTTYPEIDHVVPLRHGGAFDDPSNLQVLCRRCNRTKGAKY